MPSKLDVVSLAYDATANTTTIGFHRYNTDNADQDDLGTWVVAGNVDQNAALAYAQSMIEPDLRDQIQVSLNLSSAPMDQQIATEETAHDAAVAAGEPINTDLGDGAEKAAS